MVVVFKKHLSIAALKSGEYRRRVVKRCQGTGFDEFGEFIDWDRYWERRYERDGYTAFSVPNGMAFFRPV